MRQTKRHRLITQWGAKAVLSEAEAEVEDVFLVGRSSLEMEMVPVSGSMPDRLQTDPPSPDLATYSVQLAVIARPWP